MILDFTGSYVASDPEVTGARGDTFPSYAETVGSLHMEWNEYN